VGPENFFLFGLTEREVEDTIKSGYQPGRFIEHDPELRGAIDLIDSGLFSHGNRDLFRPFTESLTQRDTYLACADFRAYADCQESISQQYRNHEHWSRMSILNVARIGCFSSDRAVREYCRDIWKAQPVSIPAPG
jgi:starch phosphorylase